MKKSVIFICSVLISGIMLTSCSKSGNNSEYYEVFGVVREDAGGGGKLYVTSDAGNYIIPVNSVLSLSDKGSRVWMMFTVENSSIEADTVKANVYEWLKITQVKVQTDGLDNLKNDEIQKMGSMWIKQDFLTLSMLIYAYSPESLEKHNYFMYLNPQTAGDTIQMELRYDKNNDLNNRDYNKLLTIPLKDIYSAAGVQQASVLAIKYNTVNGIQTKNVKINTE